MDTSSKKILLIAQHLSTGGMPQYLYVQAKKLVEETNHKVYVLEWSDIAPIYDVQKNRIKELLPKNFTTLEGTDEEKKDKFFHIISKIKPDIIHLQEHPEMWMPDDVAEELYTIWPRDYKIIETSHDSGFAEELDERKRYLPDAFAFISDFHPKMYSELCNEYDIPYEVVEFPIIKKDRPNREDTLRELGLDPEYKHVVNVGLWTSRKNQAEIIEYAKKLKDQKIKFHFVGNQADNFRWYWEPLMENLPDNCVVWGERSDVDKFYSCMDLFLFTSRGTKTDKETNPLVLKEAIGWGIPVMLYNLEVYCGMYNGLDNVTFLENEMNEDRIMKVLNVNNQLPKRCFVTHCDEPYVPILQGLLKSHELFSNIPLVVYTINFDYDIKQNNVITIRYDADLDNSPTKHEHYEFGVEGKIKAMMLKPSIIQNCFDIGIEEICYIDSDVIMNNNIDTLFYNIKRIDNYPLLPEAQFRRMKFNEIITDESISFEEMKIPKENVVWYRQTNSMLVTQNCKQFIEDWSKLCVDAVSWGWFDDEETIKKYVPFHEETLINYLLWSKQYDDRLPQSFFNPHNLDSVKHFLEVGGTYEDSLQINDRMVIDIHEPEVERGWLAYSTNKDDVKYFHGMKQVQEIDRVVDYLKDYHESRKVPMEINFDDGDENKINFQYQAEEKRFVHIVMRDIDTWMSIWSFQTELNNYNGFWAIPIPIHHIDFKKQKGFNGFRIEFYETDEDKETDTFLDRNEIYAESSVGHRLLDVHELRIRDDKPTVPFRYETVNPLHSLAYFNFQEFFYSEVYDDYDFGKDSVVVDVGANIGAFTMYALHRGASKVYALEPVKRAFDDLKDTMVDDKVVPLQIAISDSNDEVDMYTIPWNDTIASFDREHIVDYSQGEQNIITFPVKTQKFVDFMSENNLKHIDLLKVDIEGAEYLMFDAIDDDTLLHIDKILLEFHDNFNGEFRKHILDKLDKAGFEYSFYEQTDGKHRITEDNPNGIMWAERTRKDIGVLMMYDEKYAPVGDISRKNVESYCRKNGYDFIFSDDMDTSRPLQWSKIKGLQEHLHKYQWLFWIDADCVIMDDTKKLEDFIQDDYEFITVSEETVPDTQTDDKQSPHTGHFLIKNTPTMHALLEDTWNLKYVEEGREQVHIDSFDHEMRQLRLLLNNNSDYKEKFLYLPKEELFSRWFIKDEEMIEMYPDWNLNHIYENGNFLCHLNGYRTIQERKEAMLEVLNIKPKPIIILDAYFHGEVNEKRFMESIEFYKKVGYPIMLVSNSTISKEVQEQVDYIFYDKENRLFSREYEGYTKGLFWYAPSTPIVNGEPVSDNTGTSYILNVMSGGIQKHGYSYMVNFLNSVKFAKSLGFTHVMRMEYDQLHKNEDVDFLNHVVRTCHVERKKGFIYKNETDISLDFLYLDLNLAIKKFPSIENESDFKELLVKYTGDENHFLICEELFSYCLEDSFDELIVKDGQEMFTDFNSRWNTLTSPSNTSGNLDGGYISSVFRSPTPNHVYLVSCNTHTDDKRELVFKVHTKAYGNDHGPKYRHTIQGLYNSQLDHIEIAEEGTNITCPDGTEFYLQRDTDLEEIFESFVTVKRTIQ